MINLAKRRDTFEILKSVYDKPRLLYPILRALDDSLFDSSRKVIRSEANGQCINYALYTVLFQNFDAEDALKIQGIFTTVEKKLTRKGIIPRSCIKSLRHATINVEIAEQTGIPHCHFVVYFTKSEDETGIDLEFRRFLATLLQNEASKVNHSVNVRVNVSLGAGICTVEDGKLELMIPKEKKKQYWRAEGYTMKKVTQFTSFSIKPFSANETTWGFAERAIILGLVRAQESNDVWRVLRYVQEARKFGLRLLDYRKNRKGIYLAVVGISPRSTRGCMQKLIEDSLTELNLTGKELLCNPHFKMLVEYNSIQRLMRTGELTAPPANALARNLEILLPYMSEYTAFMEGLIDSLDEYNSISVTQQQILVSLFQ